MECFFSGQKCSILSTSRIVTASSLVIASPCDCESSNKANAAFTLKLHLPSFSVALHIVSVTVSFKDVNIVKRNLPREILGSSNIFRHAI